MSEANGPEEKAAVFQDQEFVVREGFAYRGFRAGAIWMNKLFFGAIILWVLWLLLGLTGQVEPGCAQSIDVEAGDAATERCSVFLSTTSLYLGAMAVVTFLLSITFGLLGLVVGKNIVQATPAAEEVGARRAAAHAQDPVDDEAE